MKYQISYFSLIFKKNQICEYIVNYGYLYKCIFHITYDI